MLDALFGSKSSRKILLYLQTNGNGYPRGIAKTTDESLYSIQKTLAKLEEAGILSSRKLGTTRVYQWNPRCYILNELKKLLDKELRIIPAHERKAYVERRRPRRAGKPL